jgi:hypothetical protein
MEIHLDKPTLWAAQLAYWWATKDISAKEHTIKYASKDECRLYMALEEKYFELIDCFQEETAGLVIEALDVVQRGYILRAFYYEEKDFSRIQKYMTPKEMAEAMFGLNTPGYISNILRNLPKETELSIVAELTKLAIQQIERIRKNPSVCLRRSPCSTFRKCATVQRRCLSIWRI